MFPLLSTLLSTLFFRVSRPGPKRCPVRPRNGRPTELPRRRHDGWATFFAPLPMRHLAWANGSTDPTLAGWWTYDGSYNNPNAVNSLGLSVTVPLRFFDRNQGEKKRTQIDIDKSTQTSESTRAAIFSDVDSAYAQVESDITLLKPYKDKYVQQSTRVRDTVTYAYQHGGASLTDFLNAQSDYRTVQLAYLQLIGSYLTAASQLNLAVGREVIP